jgi:hypothetical protein
MIAWYAESVLNTSANDISFLACIAAGHQVHRVTRIHNRFLRNRFDKRVSDLLTCNPDLAAEIAARDGDSGMLAWDCFWCVSFSRHDSTIPYRFLLPV